MGQIYSIFAGIETVEINSVVTQEDLCREKQNFNKIQPTKKKSVSPSSSRRSSSTRSQSPQHSPSSRSSSLSISRSSSPSASSWTLIPQPLPPNPFLICPPKIIPSINIDSIIQFTDIYISNKEFDSERLINETHSDWGHSFRPLLEVSLHEGSTSMFKFLTLLNPDYLKEKWNATESYQTACTTGCFDIADWILQKAPQHFSKDVNFTTIEALICFDDRSTWQKRCDKNPAILDLIRSSEKVPKQSFFSGSELISTQTFFADAAWIHPNSLRFMIEMGLDTTEYIETLLKSIDSTYNNEGCEKNKQIISDKIPSIIESAFRAAISSPQVTLDGMKWYFDILQKIIQIPVDVWDTFFLGLIHEFIGILKPNRADIIIKLLSPKTKIEVDGLFKEFCNGWLEIDSHLEYLQIYPIIASTIDPSNPISYTQTLAGKEFKMINDAKFQTVQLLISIMEGEGNKSPIIEGEAGTSPIIEGKAEDLPLIQTKNIEDDESKKDPNRQTLLDSTLQMVLSTYDQRCAELLINADAKLDNCWYGLRPGKSIDTLTTTTDQSLGTNTNEKDLGLVFNVPALINRNAFGTGTIDFFQWLFSHPISQSRFSINDVARSFNGFITPLVASFVTVGNCYCNPLVQSQLTRTLILKNKANYHLLTSVDDLTGSKSGILLHKRRGLYKSHSDKIKSEGIIDPKFLPGTQLGLCQIGVWFGLDIQMEQLIETVIEDILES